MDSLDKTLKSIQEDEEKKLNDLKAKKYVENIVKNKEVYEEVSEKELDVLRKLVTYCEDSQDKVVSGTSLTFLLTAGYNLRCWKTKIKDENKDKFFKSIEEYLYSV